VTLASNATMRRIETARNSTLLLKTSRSPRRPNWRQVAVAAETDAMIGKELYAVLAARTRTSVVKIQA
jgi:hypothetical protein